MQFVSTYLKEVQETILALPAQEIDQVIDLLVTASEQNRTVFLCGNGGSAATASHMACDLAKNINVSGMRRFRVIALTDNVPLMTAWGNDTDFKYIFSEQLRPFVQTGDILISISTSGNSPNVLEAIRVAREAGAVNIGMTNQIGGQLKDMVDYCLHVPCTNIEQVEDIHMVLAHCLASGIRNKLREKSLISAVSVSNGIEAGDLAAIEA